jgi:hypothetical protein
MAINPKVNLHLKNKKPINGISVPKTGNDSKPLLSEKPVSTTEKNVHEKQIKKDRDKEFDEYAKVKISIPVIIDQSSFLNSEETLAFSTLKNKEIEKKGLSNGTFSIDEIKRILRSNTDNVKFSFAKEFLDLLNKRIAEIRNDKNIIDSRKNSLIFNLLHKSYYENASIYQRISQIINKSMVKNNKVIPVSDILPYNSSKPSELSNTNSRQDMSDVELFGKDIEYDLIKIPAGVENNELTTQHSEEVVNDQKQEVKSTFDTDMSNSTNELIAKMYDEGKDPSQSFKGTESHISLPAMMTSNLPSEDERSKNDMSGESLYKKTGLGTVNNSTEQLSEIINNKSSLNTKKIKDKGTLSKIQRTNYVVRPKEVVRKNKKAYIDIEVDKNDIDVDGNVTCVMKLLDSKGSEIGLNYFKKNVRTPLVRHYVAKFSKENITFGARNLVNNDWYVTIKNHHEFSVTVNVRYARFSAAKKSSNNIVAPTFVGNESYTLAGKSDVDFIIRDYPEKVFLARINYEVAKLGNKTSIDNIVTYKSSYSNLTKNINRPFLTVVNNVKRKSFSVKLHINSYMSIPTHVKFMRRDITFSENCKFIDVFDPEELEPYGFINTLAVEDAYHLKFGHTYEYIAVFLTIDGEEIYSRPFREVYYESSNFLTCGLTPVEGGSRLTITKQDGRSNTLNELIGILKELGDDKFFDDDIKLINQTSQELLSAEVLSLEVNDRTQSFSSLGEFKSGDIVPININQDRNNINNVVPKLIKIIPYQNSPLLIINQVNNLISKIDDTIGNTNADAIEKSVVLVKTKKKLDEFNANRDKYLTNDFLLKGRLPADSPNLDFKNEFQNIKKSNQVYDIETLQVSINPIQLSLNVLSMSYYSLNDRRIVLSFELQANENFKSYVDFYVITCKKEGKSYPVTSVDGHKTNYTIIDNTNKNYMGRIEYVITPFMIDGSVKSSSVIGAINYYDNRRAR